MYIIFIQIRLIYSLVKFNLIIKKFIPNKIDNSGSIRVYKILNLRIFYHISDIL